MSDIFSTEISSRICTQMNQDHADTIVLYTQAFGGVTNTTAAQMLSIDAQSQKTPI